MASRRSASGNGRCNRQWQDALLAFIMMMLCALLKNEGILLGIDSGCRDHRRRSIRRVGFAVFGSVGVAAILYLAFGPNELRIMGYVLYSQLVNVTLPSTSICS